jgi:hypothetical protein
LFLAPIPLALAPTLYIQTLNLSQVAALRIQDVSSRISDPNPNIFLSEIQGLDPDPKFFLSRILHKRGDVKNKNYLYSCSSWFQEQVKEIIHPGKKVIPDPDHGSWGKKAPDIGSRIRIRNTARYATLWYPIIPQNLVSLSL